MGREIPQAGEPNHDHGHDDDPDRAAELQAQDFDREKPQGLCLRLIRTPPAKSGAQPGASLRVVGRAEANMKPWSEA
jgi:hypothetical protein